MITTNFDSIDETKAAAKKLEKAGIVSAYECNFRLKKMF